MESSDRALTEPWNRAAPTYASDFDGSGTKLIPPLLDAAGVDSGTRMLDIGTGPGSVAAAASERGAEATGTDFAEKMVTAAREQHPNLRFEVADVTSQPFADHSFDAVVMSLVLFMLVDPAAALREAHRVLVPGGRFAASLWRFPLVGHALFYDRLADYAEAELLPGDPPLLGVSDHDVLTGALIDAEFTDPKVHEVTVFWQMETADRLFDGLASIPDLSSLSDAQLAEFRAAVAADTEVYREDGLLQVPFPALILSGARPG